jgi:serine/threonine-protein kinase
VGSRPSDRLFEVYEARDRFAAGQVVLLWVLSEHLGLSAEQLQQVARESRRAARLNHPHVASVIESGIDHGRLYILTELLACETLESRLRDGQPMPAGQAVRLAMHVCEALCYAHERGIVHGALSTASVRLPADGAVKLEDCATVGALARCEATAGYARRVRAHFISPEQARGALPGPGSDIYALGVILFRMLSGRFPFPGEDALEVARAHCVAPVPNIHDLNPRVPPPVARLVARTLAKDPEERYASARELLVELRRLAPPEPAAPPVPVAAPPAAPEPEEAEPLTRWAAAKVATWSLVRFSLQVLLAVAAAVVAVTLVFVWLFSTPRAAVRVPSVVGMDEVEAASALRARGLDLVVAGEVYSGDVPSGRIARMVSPYAGKEVREGRQVRVLVSKGPRGVQVPPVSGLRLEEATAALEKAGLSTGSVEKRRSATVREGRVVRTAPAAGAWVPSKTAVTLTVSEGPPENVQMDPDREVSFRVGVTVPGGPRSHRVEIDAVDTEGRRHTLHDELHSPGQRFEQVVTGRGWVVLRVYVDQELVREVRPEGE